MLIIPAFLESYRSLKDRTIKLVYETSELTPDQIVDLHKSLNKTGFLAFNTEPFATKDLAFISDLKVDYDDPQKTPSKRLRGVLYRNWEKTPEGYKTFEDYYRSKMELIIDHYKDKLD